MRKFTVKTIVAIAIGAALFFVLGRFVAIPSPVRTLTFQSSTDFWHSSPLYSALLQVLLQDLSDTSLSTSVTAGEYGGAGLSLHRYLVASWES